VPIDNPGAVADRLDSLRSLDAGELAVALLGRDPAACARFDDPDAVASLLYMLRQAGAEEQAAALLGRDPAARARLDDRGAVVTLLDRLRQAGAQQQFAALAGRAVAPRPEHSSPPSGEDARARTACDGPPPAWSRARSFSAHSTSRSRPSLPITGVLAQARPTIPALWQTD
jgi:hypothetical protein